MNKQKQCFYCGQVFTPKNSKARFCSTRHRVAQFRRKRRLQRNGAIVTKRVNYKIVEAENPLYNEEKVEKKLNTAEDIEEFNKFREVLNGRP